MRLETAVTEGFKELVKERREKQILEVRVEEMQTSIEQQIHDQLKAGNERLRAGLEDMKVPSPRTLYIPQSQLSDKRIDY